MKIHPYEKQANANHVTALELFLADLQNLNDKLLTPIARAAVERGEKTLLAAIKLVDQPTIEIVRAVAYTMAASNEAKAMIDIFDQQINELDKTAESLKDLMAQTDLGQDNDAQLIANIQLIASVQTQLLRGFQNFCNELSDTFKQNRVTDEIDAVVKEPLPSSRKRNTWRSEQFSIRCRNQRLDFQAWQ
ncbi:hypothetical protein EK21DRAFT_112708 [Setomelanomma holmii]|uniref:Chemotaxis protein n=1 Tax=Setomelanomma holmii TaxID=210430 RepID=A0A9P4H7I4_9PLEO|nr:hypothetical protein EK21DRAFT_112708 [Setomelanomma holmii]